jgi:methionyl-tRNA formyltransferase
VSLRIAFAGDRDIAVWVLDFLFSQDIRPLALLVPSEARGSHVVDLRQRCSFLSTQAVLVGTQFREAEGIRRLRSLELDYIIGVHFPYIVPQSVLDVSGIGFLNLHPAYLPSNRGWHTASWAILDETIAGATLHFMDAGLDTGDIVHQKKIPIALDDTADSLYKKLKQLELETFKEAWPRLVSRQVPRVSQHSLAGTFHRSRDLVQPAVQRIDLDERTTGRVLLNKLRALTTNNVGEAAYFEVGGQRFAVQLRISAIHPEPATPADGSRSNKHLN